MAYNGTRLIAILPACEEKGILYSHKGLTFGGWITARRHIGTQTMLDIWHCTIEALRTEGFRKIIYSPAPYIYDTYPADDDIYALFRLGASLTACNASSALPLSEPVLLNLTTGQCIKKASRSDISCYLSQEYDTFHRILSDVLAERHGVTPVHTADEIKMLATRFPGQIKLAMACGKDGEPLAGTIVYLSPRVAHTQYMATTHAGRELNALPLLIDRLPLLLGLNSNMYLDFGSSCTDGSRALNCGLDLKKAAMGGRCVVYNTYTLVL